VGVNNFTRNNLQTSIPQPKTSP